MAVGPISWFLSSELVPQRHRSQMQSICYAINTIMVVISSFSILPLYGKIGSYSFLLLYVGPSVICTSYLYKCLPETKGREIYDIVRELKGEFKHIDRKSINSNSTESE
ncbi:hypothetical protein WR25_27161 [Diploscapter pachys]|uniref:Major facilitator superfamily (MFS) profile domain-containing protein n=1 Tax=Diploscapter pachys TaxID=2018661 RepID=A0A2A2LWD1_9BILA|nr:hypothetical protein WR25_27161 [Diploscapter pachys]